MIEHEHLHDDGESDCWVLYEAIEISTTVLRIEANLFIRKNKLRKISLLSGIVNITDENYIEFTVTILLGKQRSKLRQIIIS